MFFVYVNKIILFSETFKIYYNIVFLLLKFKNLIRSLINFTIFLIMTDINIIYQLNI